MPILEKLRYVPMTPELYLLSSCDFVKSCNSY